MASFHGEEYALAPRKDVISYVREPAQTKPHRIWRVSRFWALAVYTTAKGKSSVLKTARQATREIFHV
jgi:hypothetical protein